MSHTPTGYPCIVRPNILHVRMTLYACMHLHVAQFALHSVLCYAYVNGHGYVSVARAQEARQPSYYLFGYFALFPLGAARVLARNFVQIERCSAC
eukprot:12090678-Heterocapsa_arctica.AAC.1